MVLLSDFLMKVFKSYKIVAATTVVSSIVGVVLHECKHSFCWNYPEILDNRKFNLFLFFLLIWIIVFYGVFLSNHIHKQNTFKCINLRYKTIYCAKMLSVCSIYKRGEIEDR